ncbi:MAG TPA: KUP/HAK/KT family potassium transporter [Bacteroidales bacterium]|nr:KUP/HAK/KT family potassium transporter [Bacteroidales bacterium]
MMKQHIPSHARRAISLSGLIITLGIVYGDIGTSPLYVMKAILAGSGGSVDQSLVLGAISCIIWTLTLQTTLKYVVISLRADNRGEGGILALYALVRRQRKWLFIFAIIGASTLLADGVITPAITIMSSVEGLQFQYPSINVIPIALTIVTALFLIQQFGTATIGKSFGPVMLIWFGMIAILGLVQVVQLPLVLKAFNPVYAVQLLAQYPGGFLLLGAVFLCTTGAEALYSDLGHCGANNIRISWIFVKLSLILNYLGQGAWILNQPTGMTDWPNPFFAIMPNWFLPIGVIVATAAAIIASQALISGSYTIVSEAIQLKLWPKVRISYPTNRKGQMYISSVNWLLFIFVVTVILIFQGSSRMEAAYGLAITLTMLMTTLLMTFYLIRIKRNSAFILGFLMIYLTIEGAFLIANLAKFSHGGWFTLMLAGIIALVMYVWYRGRTLKNRFTRFVRISDYYDAIRDLSEDTSVPKYASNLVYLTHADRITDTEAKIIFSIFNKKPKRADTYWLLHVHTTDEPYSASYSVDYLIPGKLIRVEFRLGFKVQPRINLYFKQMLKELEAAGEIKLDSSYDSLKKHRIPADFHFIIIRRIQNYDFDFPPVDQFIMDIYTLLGRLSTSDIRAYGLDTSNVVEEKVPFVLETDKKQEMKRLR